MEKVKGGLKTTQRAKPLLFFDGHPAHCTAKSLRKAREYFHPAKNVPYSCEFNSIGKLGAPLLK